MKRRICYFILAFALIFSLFTVNKNEKVYSLSKQALLDSAPLRPMKTGYDPVDKLVEKIFKEIFTDGMTTYDKIKACYDEVIYDTTYGKSFNSLGVGEVMREYGFIAERDAYVAYRANTFLTKRLGVCNDYSCAFVVLSRAVGLETYVVSGKTNTVSGGYADHMWVNARINGVYYTFDPQVEYNIMKRSSDGKIGYSRFCATDEDMKGRLIYTNREKDIALFNDFRKYGDADTATATETTVPTAAVTETQAATEPTAPGEAPAEPITVSAYRKGKIRLGTELTFAASSTKAVLSFALSDGSSTEYPENAICSNGVIKWTVDRLGKYTVVITAEGEDGETSFEYEFMPAYTLGREAGYVTGIPEKMTVMQIELQGDEYFSDKSGNALSGDDVIGTGCVLVSGENSYTVFVKGDADGDGAVSVTDYILVKRVILNTFELSGEFEMAADTDGDGKLSQTDYILIKSHMLELLDLYI